jgi:hypothetical protein
MRLGHPGGAPRRRHPASAIDKSAALQIASVLIERATNHLRRNQRRSGRHANHRPSAVGLEPGEQSDHVEKLQDRRAERAALPAAISRAAVSTAPSRSSVRPRQGDSPHERTTNTGNEMATCGPNQTRSNASGPADGETSDLSEVSISSDFLVAAAAGGGIRTRDLRVMSPIRSVRGVRADSRLSCK